MGNLWDDPACRAAVKSIALYAALFGVSACGVAGLASLAWTTEDTPWRRVPCCLAFGAGVAGMWFVGLDGMIQSHVMRETGLRPRDAAEVLHRALFKAPR